jgi:flagellar biosynthetic protein FlhB
VAEERDESQQTEAPTPRRLEDARGRGQVASSREVTTFFLLAASVLAWAATAPADAARLALAMRSFLEGAAAQRHGLDPALAGGVLLDALATGALAMAVPLALLAFAPVVAAVVQNAAVWSTESLGVKWERVSPLAGFGRVFSAKALVEFAKGLVKLAVVLAALCVALWPERAPVAASLALPLPALLDYLREVVLKLLATAAGAVGLLALLDFAHARFAMLRQLRMSRQEVMDEHKQNEGDPIVRQRLKALRFERARRRLMADVPKAKVVVTNPTHFAVALRYVAGETAAPEVLAKGVDAVALKIREVAARHKVPVVENPPLARALHAGCEVGAAIPPAHYQAVAEIVGYVLRLSGEGGQPQPAPPAPP